MLCLDHLNNRFHPNEFNTVHNPNRFSVFIQIKVCWTVNLETKLALTNLNNESKSLPVTSEQHIKAMQGCAELNSENVKLSMQSSLDLVKVTTNQFLLNQSQLILFAGMGAIISRFSPKLKRLRSSDSYQSLSY